MSQARCPSFDPVSGSESETRPNGLVIRFMAWNAKYPVWAIVMVSLLAVAINCYPVIFCGRSFVSPTSVGGMLAHGIGWPPSPGVQAQPVAGVSPHGSDTAVMMWWDVPVGFVESRSLLEHGELPLWNRYSHAGDTLIGQAVSMLGDPLQIIVILGQGSAGAWDVKFLAAKFLFSVGFGLLILRLLECRTMSLLYAALAAYCGAFFCINNHPVFFVFAYSPWILLAAVEWLDLRSGRPVRWWLVWLLANFACFNAGHVEAAVALIGGLNLAAFAYALSRCGQGVGLAKVFGRMGGGTLCFLGLTAPVWISFLVSLDGAYTAHQELKIIQFSPKALLGAFDEVFYRHLSIKELVPASAPATSLLVLAGCSFSAWRWRQLKGEPFFWVNTGAIVLWGGCVFGWVPAFLLAVVPLLNRVGHTAFDFSYLLVIHLTIQSAYGFKCLAKAERLPQVAGDVACAGGVFAGMILWFSFAPFHRPIPWDYFLCAGAGAIGAPLLFVYLKHRQQPALGIGWVGIIILGFLPVFRFGLYYFGSEAIGDDAALLLPGPRVALNAPSPALDKLKQDPSGPFRVAGLETSLEGDYSAVYGLESIFSCAPLSNGEFIDLVRASPGVNSHDVWKLELAPDQAQPLLSLLNVKYLLVSPDSSALRTPNFRLADRSDFGVLENPQVWPRAFFANQVVSLASTGEFVQHLVANGRQPFVALTPSELATQPGLSRLASVIPALISPATRFRLTANTTEFDVHASSAGVVCLTEGQAKDFTALANHTPKAVLTVNRAFKGIYLDQPGDYHVQFNYRPRHWRLACALFGLAAGAAMILAILSLTHEGKVLSARHSQ
jgi:hypothetical protein